MDKKSERLRALIADQNQNLRQIVRGLLYDYGLRLDNIEQCADGEEALQKLARAKFDFLITGWRMTPMDGLTLTRTLRNPDVTPAPGIPIIFCSSFLDRRLLDDVRQAGANEVIVKPINAGAINSRVTAILEQPRPLITVTDYVGPDRRRLPESWLGIERRAKDRDWFIC